MRPWPRSSTVLLRIDPATARDRPGDVVVCWLAVNRSATETSEGVDGRGWMRMRHDGHARLIRVGWARSVVAGLVAGMLAGLLGLVATAAPAGAAAPGPSSAADPLGTVSVVARGIVKPYAIAPQRRAPRQTRGRRGSRGRGHRLGDVGQDQ